MPEVKLSLLNRSGRVHHAGGLNWGFGEAHTRLNDAYIPVRMKDLKSGLIPAKAGADAVTVEVLWDDGQRMNMTFEGSQEFYGRKYPKQLSSADSKDLLGKYMRDRLGVAYDSPVTMADLDRYGRKDISLIRREDGNYFIDFSV